MNRHFLNVRIASLHPALVASAFALSFGTLACSGATDTSGASGSDVSTQASELESAQCALKAYEGEADDCRIKFESCVTDGGDKETCRSTLEGCLPAAPPEGPEGQGPAGRPGPKPPLPGEPRPEGCDGPQPPPPPDAKDDGGPRPPQGPPPPPGHRPHPRPEPEELRACHEALRACFDGATSDADKKACVTKDRECAQAAFAVAFETRCKEVTEKCAAGGGEVPADACDEIAERCAAGVAPPPSAKQPVCN